ncbi:hypothetical protein ACHAWF_002222 [Thalassiosira exigua]
MALSPSLPSRVVLLLPKIVLVVRLHPLASSPSPGPPFRPPPKAYARPSDAFGPAAGSAKTARGETRCRPPRPPPIRWPRLLRTPLPPAAKAYDDHLFSTTEAECVARWVQVSDQDGLLYRVGRRGRSSILRRK